jgi:hypothetical protein
MRNRIFLFILAALAAIPAVALPPNLLSEGNFDSLEATRTWTQRFTRNADVNETPQIISWIGVDALGSPASGSMVLSGVGRAMQCVAISGGKEYDFGARILTSKAGQPLSAAHLELSFFADDQCATEALTVVPSDAAASIPGRFTAIGATRKLAPAGAKAAAVTVVIEGREPQTQTARRASIYVDDVFLQESGGCVPDAQTLCLASGKLRATAVYHGPHGEAIAAPVVALSGTTGYFFTYSAHDPEVTIKAIDLSGFDGKWIVVGGLTNLQLEITVEDLTVHQQRTYRNPAGRFLEPIVDTFPGQ